MKLARRRRTFVVEHVFDLKFDGPALEHHEMDVRALAPAMLAFADLLQSANRELDPLAPELNVNVRATGEGSFLLQLKAIYDDAVATLHSDQATALTNLTGNIGFVWMLMSELIKRRGRHIVHDEPAARAGWVSVTLDDGTTFEIPAEVLQLERSPAVRKALDEAMEPLDRAGIDEVAIVEDGEEVQRVNAVERTYLSVLHFDEPSEVLSEQRVELNVTIVTLPFQQGRKWRLDDGNRPFYADMEDDRFSERVVEAQESFSSRDVLRCRVRITQYRVGGALRTDFVVEEVLEHLPAPPMPPPGEQLDLGG
jgi:hypothetical protein